MIVCPGQQEGVGEDSGGDRLVHSIYSHWATHQRSDFPISTETKSQQVIIFDQFTFFSSGSPIVPHHINNSPSKHYPTLKLSLKV